MRWKAEWKENVGHDLERKKQETGSETTAGSWLQSATRLTVRVRGRPFSAGPDAQVLREGEGRPPPPPARTGAGSRAWVDAGALPLPPRAGLGPRAPDPTLPRVSAQPRVRRWGPGTG